MKKNWKIFLQIFVRQNHFENFAKKFLFWKKSPVFLFFVSSEIFDENLYFLTWVKKTLIIKILRKFYFIQKFFIELWKSWENISTKKGVNFSWKRKDFWKNSGFEPFPLVLSSERFFLIVQRKFFVWRGAKFEKLRKSQTNKTIFWRRLLEL